jgi:hypothetical protein
MCVCVSGTRLGKKKTQKKTKAAKEYTAPNSDLERAGQGRYSIGRWHQSERTSGLEDVCTALAWQQEKDKPPPAPLVHGTPMCDEVHEMPVLSVSAGPSHSMDYGIYRVAH